MKRRGTILRWLCDEQSAKPVEDVGVKCDPMSEDVLVERHVDDELDRINRGHPFHRPHNGRREGIDGDIVE
jgi:hypothetical protein